MHGQVATVDTLEELGHGHVRQALVSSGCGEEGVIAGVEKRFDQGASGVGKRNTVLTLGLHPLRTDDPNSGLQVEFRSARADHLVGSGSRQNGELKRRAGGAFLRTDLPDEARNVGIGQRRMVLYFLQT